MWHGCDCNSSSSSASESGLKKASCAFAYSSGPGPVKASQSRSAKGSGGASAAQPSRLRSAATAASKAVSSPSWVISKWFFGACYLIELLLRVATERADFVFGVAKYRNLFDILALLSFLEGLLPNFFQMLRVLRFFKTLRILKLLRYF